MMMDADPLSWWQVAQLAGAGGCFVFLLIGVPSAIYTFRLLWDHSRELQAHNHKNEDYIRESDKNTLSVLSELTLVLRADGTDAQRRHQELLKAIEHAVETINRHTDDRTRESSAKG